MELAISIFAALVALLSLGWQAFEWKRSAGRVKATGAILQVEGHAAELSVRLTNDGRASCQVVGLLLAAADGRSAFDPSQYAIPGSPDFPTQLDAGHTLTFRYGASRIARALAHHDMTSEPHYFSVWLGDGTVQRSKGTITFALSLISDDDAPIHHEETATRVLASMQRPTRRPRR